MPKIFDDSTEKTSYVVAMFSNFVTNTLNPDFKLSTVRFDIACPYDEWVLDDKSLQYQNVYVACVISFLRCKRKNDNIFIASVWSMELVVMKAD